MRRNQRENITGTSLRPDRHFNAVGSPSPSSFCAQLVAVAPGDDGNLIRHSINSSWNNCRYLVYSCRQAKNRKFTSRRD
jgi:hypothetical protein